MTKKAKNDSVTTVYSDEQMTAVNAGEIVISDVICDENRAMDGDHIAQLIANIEAVGLINPITLSRVPDSYPPVYAVVAGRSRFRALSIIRTCRGKLLPGEYNIVEKSNAGKISFSENFLRRDLTMKEEIDQLEELHDKENLSVPELMKLLGRSKTWVKSRLNLKNLIPEAREKIGDPECGISTVKQWVEVAKFPPEIQKEMLECLEGDSSRSDEEFVKDIESEFTQKLDGKYFGLEDSLEGLPTCAECQFRTGADVDLFGELSGDGEFERCLKPKCFEEKKEIVRQKRLKEAKADGMIICGGWGEIDVARTIGYITESDIDPDGTPNCYVHLGYSDHAGKRVCLNAEALTRVREPEPPAEKPAPKTAEEKAAAAAEKREAEICKKVRDRLAEIIKKRLEQEQYFNWDEMSLLMIIRSVNLRRTVYKNGKQSYTIKDIPEDIRHYVPTAEDLRPIEEALLQDMIDLLKYYNQSVENTRILTRILEEDYDELANEVMSQPAARKSKKSVPEESDDTNDDNKDNDMEEED